MSTLTLAKVNKYFQSSYDELYENKIQIMVDENDFRNIHFVFEGAKKTPYEGGYYYGLIILHDQHPHKPPTQYMMSPSGRYVFAKYFPPTNEYAICTSQTGFHPETWSPQINFSQYLIAFVSMFPDVNDYGIGSITTTPEEKKKFAKSSKAYLISCTKFKEIFPDFHKALVDNNNPFPPKVGSSKSTKMNATDLDTKMKDLGLDSDEDKPKPKKVIKKKVVESSSESESEEEIFKSKKKPSKKKVSSSESESEEEVKPKKKGKAKKVSSESESESESEEEVKPKKKKKAVSDSDSDEPKKKKSGKK